MLRVHETLLWCNISKTIFLSAYKILCNKKGSYNQVPHTNKIIGHFKGCRCKTSEPAHKVIKAFASRTNLGSLNRSGKRQGCPDCVKLVIRKVRTVQSDNFANDYFNTGNNTTTRKRLNYDKVETQHNEDNKFSH